MDLSDILPDWCRSHPEETIAGLPWFERLMSRIGYVRVERLRAVAEERDEARGRMSTLNDRERELGEARAEAAAAIHRCNAIDRDRRGLREQIESIKRTIGMASVGDPINNMAISMMRGRP